MLGSGLGLKEMTKRAKVATILPLWDCVEDFLCGMGAAVDGSLCENNVS